MDLTRWCGQQVQWHPASGAKVRRVALSRRGVLKLCLVLASAILAAAWLAASLDETQMDLTLDSAWRENSALKARQAALLERARVLNVRLSEVVALDPAVLRIPEESTGSPEGFSGETSKTSR